MYVAFGLQGTGGKSAVWVRSLFSQYVPSGTASTYRFSYAYSGGRLAVPGKGLATVHPASSKAGAMSARARTAVSPEAA
jgi:hypothetical protein